MSAVFSKKSSNNVTPINNGSKREPTPYDGVYLNIGVITKDKKTKEETFVRLPYGVHVADLKPRKIFDNMSKEFAAQVRLENSMITEIQNAALQLEEGGTKSTEVLAVQLYKRKEEIETEVEDEVTIGIFS